jgi:two-component system, chemotaxis family, chemotaxis protein CheY
MNFDKNFRVIIIDDYTTMLRILRNLLRQIGIENVEDATNGTDALGKLRTLPFNLIISDWNMQPMTGLDLLREVRADEKLKATPFIMVTAESKTDNVIAAKKAGVSNYIVKPFNAETLRAKIESVLAVKAA